MTRSSPLLLLLAALAAPAAAQQPNSENTLRLEEGAARPAAAIADVAWLAGYWRGEGFGGALEELWLPAAGDRMHGIFTLTREGKAVFSEAMQVAEEEGSLVLRVKHFTPEFVGWEEKDGMVRFPLVKLGENEAFFNGLTIRRDGDRLVIWIVLSQAGERTEHELTFERAAL